MNMNSIVFHASHLLRFIDNFAVDKEKFKRVDVDVCTNSQLVLYVRGHHNQIERIEVVQEENCVNLYIGRDLKQSLANRTYEEAIATNILFEGLASVAGYIKTENKIDEAIDEARALLEKLDDTLLIDIFSSR